MYILGIVMAVIGGVAFASIVVYYLIDHRRTGILYRAHKRVLFPVIVVSWLLFAAGGFTIAGANGDLDGGVRDIEFSEFEVPSPLFLVFFLVCAASVVYFWVRDSRKKKK